jgi:uncharacterized protein YjbJ (UPF0337 family)
MDWAHIQADWQHYSGLARQRWARLTAADLDVIAGQRELLAAHIQHTYGISMNAAQMQLESWQGQQREADPA